MSLIDTAEMYAEGDAEVLAGEAIKGRRDQFFLVSKVLPHHASVRGTIDACDGSLLRLGVDARQIRRPLVETVELFASEVHDPETLNILTQAFDRAWSEIECRYVQLPSLREETRRRLADCILQVVKDGIRDPERVKNSALVILAVERN